MIHLWRKLRRHLPQENRIAFCFQSPKQQLLAPDIAAMADKIVMESIVTKPETSVEGASAEIVNGEATNSDEVIVDNFAIDEFAVAENVPAGDVGVEGENAAAGSSVECESTAPRSSSDAEVGNTRYQRMAKYIWNPENREFCGRSGARWVKISVFSTVFYVSLAIFWIIMFLGFFNTLRPGSRPGTVQIEEPDFTFEEVQIGTNPGLGFRPLIPKAYRKTSSLIEYNITDAVTMDYWVESLRVYLDPYLNQTLSPSLRLCDNLDHANDDYVCYVPTVFEEKDSCSFENRYGFPHGQPCILVKLNRIYGWMPEDYDTPPEELVKNLEDGNKFVKGFVYITCDGEDKEDKKHAGIITYYPSQGMSFSGYPFKNQKNYLSPYVFVQFQGIKVGVKVKVECRAWANNIIYNRTDWQGSVYFELLVKL